MDKLLKSLLINPQERRLRSGWRLLLHGLLILLILGTSLGLVGGVLSVIGESLLDTNPMVLRLVELMTLFSILTGTWIARRVLDRRSFTSLGFQLNRHALPDLAFGFMLPALLMALIFTVEWALGWLHVNEWAWESLSMQQWLLPLLFALISQFAVGIQEETLSRGYHLQTLRDGIGLPGAVFVSSAIFSVLHLANPHANAASFLGILAAGIFLAYGWIRTGSLWLSIGVHIGWNFFQGPIFGFPVSGVNMFHLVSHTVQGPVLFTGGDFGPEAGLLVIPAMALGLALIWAYTRSRVKPPRA